MKKRLIPFLSVVLLTAALNSSCNKKDDGPTPTANEKVQIGALLSLTGNWSTLGITSQAAIGFAIEDINLSFRKKGYSIEFTSTVFDTKLEAGLASQYIADAYQKGIHFIIGPQSSAEAAAVKPFADANNVLVVSQGSTAGSLSIADDNLFRFCPADNVEGAAMAQTIYNDGIRALVTVSRDDAGNKGLQAATGNAFQTKGGATTSLTPYATDITDFSNIVSEIRSTIINYRATHSKDAIAVYLASFDECVDLFNSAAEDSILTSVRWYGADGVALSAALTTNEIAAAFAIKTQFFAPAFGLPTSNAAKWEPLAKRIRESTGIEPDAFALATYDALWVLAKVYEQRDSAKISFYELKNEFMLQAKDFDGATGSTKLNEAGDRADGSFDYWGISKENGQYVWTLKGRSE